MLYPGPIFVPTLVVLYVCQYPHKHRSRARYFGSATYTIVRVCVRVCAPRTKSEGVQSYGVLIFSKKVAFRSLRSRETLHLLGTINNTISLYMSFFAYHFFWIGLNVLLPISLTAATFFPRLVLKNGCQCFADDYRVRVIRQEKPLQFILKTYLSIHSPCRKRGC